ncbi:MAG: aminopeptidase P family protein [Bacillota bacterium]
MKKRIKKMRDLMENENINALLISKDVNRFYLSGFTGSSGLILFTPKDNYFITDFRYTEQAGAQTEGYKILEVNRNIPEKINEILKEDNVEELAFESTSVSYDKFKEYDKKFENTNLVATKELVKKLRIIKEEKEIEKIKKAVEITDKAFDHILDFIEEGKTEREIALELEYFMKKNGGQRNAFDFIVASGKRSSMPHGVASNKKVENGDFITMDFGTFYEGYCSDMTRTVVLGEVSEKQKEIYNIVLKAQREVIKNVKAGMTGKEMDSIARDIIEEAGYKDNFGHGLGHGIGVEVHESPRASYTSDDELKEGMLVTDEPGIYLPDWGGVRIEDDLIITKNGCEVLNQSPKELIVIK